MPRKIRPNQRIIHWNPKTHTLIRSSVEPYDLGPVYKTTAVDPKPRRRGWNSHAFVDDRVQRKGSMI
ncbi:hypothetical protein Lacidipiscis_00266 [Ligilactobacillus acidipiscis]|nr:hypothetical protein Lacidipiscis_00266 [Ligilactobacillus acidipiscis]